MSNKDEALRARDVAEDWMSKADFTAARRFATKAQKMDASLKNVVSRMIMVCDVHCAALEKSEDETDWYKILKVEQNADDNAIKKQYRKLALHLHPDKNTLPGAESAFKIIGEAQRVLLDKDKRRLHDLRRKPVFRRPAPAPSFTPQQAPTTPVFTQRFQTNFTQRFGMNLNATRKMPENQKKPQPQPTGFGGGSNFRTSCSFCHKKHEYQREFINKLMNCVYCGKQYVAFQETFQVPPVQATFPIFQQNNVPTQEADKAAENFRTSCSFCHKKHEYRREFINKPMNCVYCGKQYVAFQETFQVPPVQATFPIFQQNNVPTQEADKAAEKKPENSAKSSSTKEGFGAKSSGTSAVNKNGKRKRKTIVVVSSDSEEVPAGGLDSGSTGGQHSRRSVRSKQQVSYKENKSDDDNKEEDAETESDFRKKSHHDQLFAETLPNGINRTKKIKKNQVGSSRDSGACNVAKDSSSGSSKSIFPRFRVFVRKSYLTNLLIPASFVKEHLPREHRMFKIHNADRNKSWDVRYWRNENQGYDGHFTAGWTRLCKDYPVAVGDTCEFTLMNKNELVLRIKP